MHSNAAQVLEATRPNRITGAGRSTNSLIRYIARVYLGYGHDGLRKVAKDHGIDIDRLDQGEFVAFANNAQTAVKVFAPGNIVAYLKMPGERKLTPEIIASIPTMFNGDGFKFSNKVKMTMRSEYRDA
jgi:hypothetical protein